MDPLEAIIPIDGRYFKKLKDLSKYFSEFSFIRERLNIEVKYLIDFIKFVEKGKLKEIPKNWEEILMKIVENFDIEEAKKVKEIESKLKHDVFTIVTYLKEKLKEKKLEILVPFVHFGLTSEDVNNIAISIILKKYNEEVLLPEIKKLIETLENIAIKNIDTIMLGRTHGVPAVPTTLGRFLANYVYRLSLIYKKIKDIKFPGKIGGAVGDFNALKFAYKNIDWILFSKSFVESFGLEYFPAVTQILPYDKISEYLLNLLIMSSILSNLCKDLWMLYMLEYIKVRSKSEIHSSTMPHKKNPSILENSEGSFDLASNNLSYIATRLIFSRLHRDLSDSIIRRFFSLPLSLLILGIRNLKEFLQKIDVNREKMLEDLRRHPEVLSEALQIYLRKKGIKEGYDLVKDKIDNFENILEEFKKKYNEIRDLSPEKYIGEAIRITKYLIEEARKLRSDP